MNSNKINDPMSEMVTLQLPRATGREENYVFVGLNGKGYKVMRGVPVRVPRPVADILREAENQRRRQAEFIRQQQEAASRSAVSAGL